MTHYILDTHPLVWFVEGNKRLSEKAKLILLDNTSQLVIPTIVLVEIKFLYSRKRIKVDIDGITRGILEADNCTVYPLDEEVVEKIPLNLDIHDAIICATALVYRDVLGYETKLISRDEEIMRSGIVETIW